MLFSSGRVKPISSSSSGTRRVRPSAFSVRVPSYVPGARPRPVYTSIQSAWFRRGATLIGKPPRPARAFSGTSWTGFHPVVSLGAAGLPGFQAQSACVGSVTFM
jgi:hypothetical protein